MAIATATRTAIPQRITEATPSPLEHDEGDRLAGQGEAQRGLALLDASVAGASIGASWLAASSCAYCSAFGAIGEPMRFQSAYALLWPSSIR